MSSPKSHGVDCYVRGYHVYQRIWNPLVGEVASAVVEEDNVHDRYAVAVLESDTCCCVGHLPREISKECYYFLKMGGMIKVTITGQHRRSNLPQGGLEVPCVLFMEHKEEKIITKAKKIFGEKGFSEVHSSEVAGPSMNNLQTGMEKVATKEKGKSKTRKRKAQDSSQEKRQCTKKLNS